MSMTKKDFEVIVSAIRELKPYLSLDLYELMVQEFSDKLEAAYPRFRPSLFIVAALKSERHVDLDAYYHHLQHMEYQRQSDVLKELGIGVPARVLVRREWGLDYVGGD